MDKISRKFRFGIPNLMIYITATMLAVYALEFVTNFSVSNYLAFVRDWIFQGQIWRAITFIVIPNADSSPIFVLISLYFYYFIGSTLENAWGSNQFTFYYLFGVAGAIIAGLITGYGTNSYLNLSLFFAFASLFPEQRVMLFFIIPVKIKFLAYLNWAFFALSFITGGWVNRIAILFSLLNYFLFFGPDNLRKLKERMRYAKNRREFRKQRDQYRDYWNR